MNTFEKDLFVTISENAEYSYLGFKKEGSGPFDIDKDLSLYSKSGYFDGGNAEKIDRPNKFFLLFPQSR
jgi:hypothetical protein